MSQKTPERNENNMVLSLDTSVWVIGVYFDVLNILKLTEIFRCSPHRTSIFPGYGASEAKVLVRFKQ